MRSLSGDLTYVPLGMFLDRWVLLYSSVENFQTQSYLLSENRRVPLCNLCTECDFCKKIFGHSTMAMHLTRLLLKYTITGYRKQWQRLVS